MHNYSYHSHLYCISSPHTPPLTPHIHTTFTNHSPPLPLTRHIHTTSTNHSPPPPLTPHIHTTSTPLTTSAPHPSHPCHIHPTHHLHPSLLTSTLHPQTTHHLPPPLTQAPPERFRASFWVSRLNSDGTDEQIGAIPNSMKAQQYLEAQGESEEGEVYGKCIVYN